MVLTTADKKWLDSRFATKEDLKRFATKEDLQVSNISLRLEIDETKRELKDEINSKHDEVMTVLDSILKEVVAGREHDLVINHQQEKQNQRLDKLEAVVGIVAQ